ncbi:MAG: CehA/McbA family metallohydrolase [Synechococcales cyanobacterium]
MQTVFQKPGRFWKGNLHTHSTQSDGTLSPQAVCQRYQEAGYDFLALSDHFLDTYDWPITDTQPYRSATFTTLISAELHTLNHTMELGHRWHILAVGLPFDFAPSPPEETGPALAARALDTGAFVAAVHPQWFLMTEADVLSLEGIHGLEVFNAGGIDDNDTADGAYMLDYMLARGKRLTALATDDAHFVPESNEHMLGWVMVKAETLTPESILSALKAGDFYASTGPQLLDVHLEPGRRLYVRSTPAVRIYALGRPTESRSVAGHGLQEAEFDLRHWRSPYVRLLVRDPWGQRAWSNPFWWDG